jgi:hypothetical protein
VLDREEETLSGCSSGVGRSLEGVLRYGTERGHQRFICPLGSSGGGAGNGLSWACWRMISSRLGVLPQVLQDGGPGGLATTMSGAVQSGLCHRDMLTVVKW